MKDIAELLAHALALENEACDRYAELAEQMRMHNNTVVAEIFQKMSEIESVHAGHIRQLISEHHPDSLPACEAYKWKSPEGPETTDHGALHYLMTPSEALKLALFNEQRAFDFLEDDDAPVIQD